MTTTQYLESELFETRKKLKTVFDHSNYNLKASEQLLEFGITELDITTLENGMMITELDISALENGLMLTELDLRVLELEIG